MTRKVFEIAAAAAAAAVLCGCDPTQGAAETEASRTSRLYSNAMDDLQAGRTEAAIRGFERVTLDEPKSYSAHFQLATLLQDVKKDYIGAIAHYREYLARRPRSDKAAIAQDRIRLCETQLAAEYAKKSVSGDAVQAENERLKGECGQLEEKVKKLERELVLAQRKAETLQAEIEGQRKLMKKMSGDETEPSAKPASVSEALAQLRAGEEESQRRRTRPTDADLLDDEPPPDDRIKTSEDIKRLRVEMDREDAADAGRERPAATSAGRRPSSSTAALDGLFDGGKKADTRTRPERYIVRDGDTLFAISTKFYGSSRMWRKIREMNKATVPPDGRLKAGQEIRLP